MLMVDRSSCNKRLCNKCDGYRKRVEKLEKEAEKREKGCDLYAHTNCYHCDNTGQYNICVDNRVDYVCSLYYQRNYCGKCGRKLVEVW